MSMATDVDGRKLTIAVEPTYSVTQLEQMLKPLSEWVKKNTTHELKLVPYTSYINYWDSIHQQKPDLALDPSHIASHRINQQNYQALVRTVEPAVLHLIVDQQQTKDIERIEDFLLSKKIAALHHPSMASILYERWFGGSIIMPDKVPVHYSYSEGIDMIFDAQAGATIVPEWLLNLYPNFKSIKQSKPELGLTLLASPGLDAETVREIKNAFIAMKGQRDAYEALVEWNTKYFVEAKNEEYKGLSHVIPTDDLTTALMYLNQR